MTDHNASFLRKVTLLTFVDDTIMTTYTTTNSLLTFPRRECYGDSGMSAPLANHKSPKALKDVLFSCLHQTSQSKYGPCGYFHLDDCDHNQDQSGNVYLTKSGTVTSVLTGGSLRWAACQRRYRLTEELAFTDRYLARR